MRARDNPFATERVLQLRYQFPGDQAEAWRTLMDRLDGLQYRAALVGWHGSGKTTLLEDLGVRLREQGFRTHGIFLNAQDRSYPAHVARLGESFGDRDIILFDGCEQLGLLDWWRFRWQTRRARGLIVTMHRAGRLPVLWHCSTNPDLLRELVGCLLDTASIADMALIQRLYSSHAGNLREALRELYDMAARSGPLEFSTPVNVDPSLRIVAGSNR